MAGTMGATETSCEEQLAESTYVGQSRIKRSTEDEAALKCAVALARLDVSTRLS